MIRESTSVQYVRGDTKLSDAFARLGEILHQFNSAGYEDEEKKKLFLAELLGTIRENVHIEHNFHCDLRKNIHVGCNFYAGFTCTILDIVPVHIGDNCLIGSDVRIYTADHNIDRFANKKRNFLSQNYTNNLCKILSYLSNI